MIKRYEPMILTNIIGDKPVAIMWPDDNGGYVAEVAHRAAVRELVEALQAVVDCVRVSQEDTIENMREIARAAIAKHQEGKE